MMSQGATSGDMDLATRGIRVMAGIVDFIIGVAVIVVASIIGITIGGEDSSLSNTLATIFWIVYMVGVWFMVATSGQSPGKRLLGIKIVKLSDGNVPGWGTTLLRELLGKIVSWLVLMLGFIWILFDEKNQGWHDKIASTVVVRAG